MNIGVEFDRQIHNLVAKGFPESTGMSKQKFIDMIEPLKSHIDGTGIPEPDLDAGILPFVIVVNSSVVPAETAMQQVERGGKRGIVSMYPVRPADFSPIQSVAIPDSPAYLVVSIDRGREFLNIRPEDALKAIQSNGRSPLTIDEGIAILMQYPDFLMKNNCFSLLASRRVDQRVPAIWISEGRPKLGWCWDRNPHTWLGSASCARRIS